jgi:hypothetical protein
MNLTDEEWMEGLDRITGEDTKTLDTVPLSEVTVCAVEQVTTGKALPLYPGMLAALVGEGESCKTLLACHAAIDLAEKKRHVLILDGEMSKSSWRQRLDELGTTTEALTRVHYAELGEDSADVDLVRATVSKLGAVLVVWDSALSLLSLTTPNENDNVRVGQVYNRLRAIVRDGAAGLIVDHTARGSLVTISRGATAKFNAVDLAYGVKLGEGSVPNMSEPWSSVVTVEKDRHGLLGDRHDREATFVPLGSRMLEVDLVKVDGSSHRLTTGGTLAATVAQIAALHPTPTSGNDAFRRLGGNRATVLAAYQEWKQHQVDVL